MTKQKSYFADYIKPFAVLVVICLTVAALLGAANALTKGAIAENERIKAETTRYAVMPEAKGFEEISCDTAQLGIISAYRETGGAGYVITAGYRGYGGTVTVTVGLDNSGKVIGVNADVSTETTGVGSKAGQESYTSRFTGLTGSSAGVDTISGATRTSTAVKNGVDAALRAFGAVKEAAQK